MRAKRLHVVAAWCDVNAVKAKMGRERDLTALEAEAVAWVQKLSIGESTAQDSEDAANWRGRSPAHDAAFTEAARVWDRAEAVARALPVGSGDIFTELDRLRHRRTLSRRAVLGGGIAALAVSAAYGSAHPPFGLWPSLPELRADYRTATGEQKQVIVAGDVAVNLNTQTSLKLLPPEGGDDHVELVGGEAAFTLPPRGRGVLIVSAQGGRTVIQAGRFDFRMLGSGHDLPVSVTCLEGRAHIERGGQMSELVTGQRVRYGADAIGQVAAIDPASASDWQRGIVEFRDMPLAEAVEEINRYRPGRIILASSALGSRRLSGRFRIDQMNMVLTQLEQSFSARVRQLPGGIVILSSAAT